MCNMDKPCCLLSEAKDLLSRATPRPMLAANQRPSPFPCIPGRDRLPPWQPGGMIDAAAGVNRGARERGGVAGGGGSQQAERVRRIGVLMNLAADDPEALLRMTAFVQRLQSRSIPLRP